jgi:hypothetical protein
MFSVQAGCGSMPQARSSAQHEIDLRFTGGQMSKSLPMLAGTIALAAVAAGDQALAFTAVPVTGTDVNLAGNTNVPPPGYPDFWSYDGSATLTQARHDGNFTFTYTDIFNPHSCPSCAAVFDFPSGAYAVQNLDLTLTATFNTSGQFLSGTYSIAGSLPPSSRPTYGTAPSGVSWSSTSTPLFTAKLTGATVNMSTDALGFTTSDFGGWADQPQFTGGSTSESVWIYAQLSCQTANQNSPLCTNSTRDSLWNTFLAQLKHKDLDMTGCFKGLDSIATVPIPAAVVLFGSGLAGLGAALRRRRVAVAAA